MEATIRTWSTMLSTMTSLFPNPATRTLCRSLIDDRCLPADNAALRKRKCRSSSLSLSLSLAPSRCSVHFVMIMLIACSCNHSAWQCAGPGVGRSIDKDLQMERALPATLINRPLLIRPDHLHRDIIAQARSPLSFPPLSHDIKYRRFWKTRPPRSDLSTIFLRFFLK